MTASVRVRGITHSYGSTLALQDLGFEVAAGEVLALVGPSGCGKSTALELVAGLLEPSEGSVEVAGATSAGERLGGCAWMPQRDCLLPWYSAIDNAALALRNRGRPRREARAVAAQQFERFGLAGFEQARPDELSGGMRQRVAFLRTLVSGKPVLLLDEPLAALDAITRADLQDWLGPALTASGATTLLVTHDVEEALYLADRVLVLSPRPGRIVMSVEGSRGVPGERAAVVSSAAFNERRQQVLDLLRSGGELL